MAMKPQSARQMKMKLLRLSKQLEPTLIAIRRSLHEIPEPSFEEYETQRKICFFLKAVRIPHRRIPGTTGVVGIIEGSAKRTIALRADMDALSLDEQTNLPFKSRNKGYMHACGHDAHMAIVLGAGRLLKELGKELPGRVKLIFQPAEESPPGGALELIRRGVLKKPKVDAIIGTHVSPALAAGRVAFNHGAISAAADDFEITITGRGGHGSSPHKGIDAIVVAAYFITQLQTIVSRRVSALENVVVSIGKIRGGYRDNIIADTVELEGTVRTRSDAMRKAVPAMMKQVLDATCSSFGASARFEYIEGYPAVICNEQLTTLAEEACRDLLGERNVLRTSEFEMGAEDFAHYARKVPGTIIFVGVASRRKRKVFELHHPRFDIDEAALRVGAAALAYTAYKWLEQCAEGSR